MNRNLLLLGLFCFASSGACQPCLADGEKKDDSSKKESKEKQNTKSNRFRVRPEPSMSSNSPAFQSPLTKMIRSKGHADYAYRKGDLEKAKRIYLRCISDPSVNHRYLGFCYKRLGEIYEKQGEFSKAKEQYGNALAQMKKFKNRPQQEHLEMRIKQLDSKSSEAKKD